MFFYISRLKTFRKTSKLVHILFIVLTVDAFRTLFESIYFGTWYTSLSGFLPANIGQVLTQPEYVFIPKIVNVVAGLAVVRIILNYWVPEEKRERERIAIQMNQLENTVRERTEELQDLFDGAAFGIIMLNEFSEIQDANVEACFRLGYTQEEMLHLGLQELIVSQGAVQDMENVMASLKKHESVRQELCWVRKDGSPIQIELIIQRLQRNAKYLMMFLDITERKVIEKKLYESEAALLADSAERKRTETALAQSEARFRTALLEAPFPIMIHADGDEVMLISRAWTELSGYTHSDIPTISAWTRKAYGTRMVQVRSYIESLYGSNARRDDGEFEVTCKDGSKRIWYFYSVPLDSFADGRHIVLSMAFDLTEYKRLENELVNSKIEAESSSKAKSEFLANMSHEIRTPLNGIFGMLQLIGTTSLNEEQDEFISVAMRSTKRLARLLSDILDLSRIEAGKLTLEVNEFSMSEQKQAVVELFAASAREKGLKFDYVIDDQIPARIMGDKSRLQQILFNLVGNAIKFTEQGYVKIEVSRLPSVGAGNCRILVSVADTGIGITDEQIKSIFEPFAQAEKNFNRRFQGAGLGLSIVRRLVHLMGGEIAIDNTAGGTIAYLTLPFTYEEPLQAGAHNAGLGRAELSECNPSLRILLVEDDEVSLLYGKRLLEKYGHSITTATNGLEALDRLRGQAFDLIFMDIQMPVMDGVEATKVIRGSSSLGERARTPIIAMTAYAMVGEEEQFLRAGMDGYIAKPTDGNTIRAVMNRVLEKASCLPSLRVQ